MFSESYDLSNLATALPILPLTTNIAMAAPVYTTPILVADPGNWDGKNPSFRPWWTKTKLWINAQICGDFPATNVGQAVCSHLGGDAEGFALALIDQYEEASWPSWQDITEGEGDDRQVVRGLRSIIESRFTCGDRPELMLKKLRECKQGQKGMEDFLTEFENLKILAKIGENHAMEILQ